MQHNTSSRGNVLFITLIAVGLFAALSFAITRNWNSGGGNLSKEQSRLNATGILDFGNSLRSVIDQMILLGGASDVNSGGNGILFAATGADAAYGVVGAQPTTEIFHRSGGKTPYQTPPPGSCLSACAYEFTGQYTITGVSSDSKAELALVVVNVDPTLCQMANDILNTGFSSIPAGGALTLTRFNGTNYGELGGANPVTLGGSFSGKRGFCYRESSGAGRNIYLHVIRAR